jgi:hypothetical protein
VVKGVVMKGVVAMTVRVGKWSSVVVQVVEVVVVVVVVGVVMVVIVVVIIRRRELLGIMNNPALRKLSLSELFMNDYPRWYCSRPY